jgi:hypothetical protein
METFKNVMTVINFIVSALIVWIFFDFMIALGTSNDGWVLFGFLLISVIFSIGTVILTIPFLIVLVKVKYANMKLYFYAHMLLVALTVSLVATAFLVA